MDKEIRNKQPVHKIILNQNRSEIIEEKFNFILMGGRVITNAVTQHKLFSAIIGKEERKISQKGESIIMAINRLNLRKYEIEYIILDEMITRSVETETITTVNSSLIYSKHDSK